MPENNFVEMPAESEIQLNDPNAVPPEDSWSWHPVDWYNGIKREIQEFNLEMNDRKRVVYNMLTVDD
jgi:hypothetical protein